MTTEWPDAREDQINTIRTVCSDINSLERQYVPATITDIEEPTEVQLQTAWNSVYDGSPQYASKVLQLDTTKQRVLNTYSAVPYFANVMPAMQSNWELLDSFRQEVDGPVADFDSVTLSQDFEKLVLLMKLRSLNAGTTSSVQVRVNGSAAASYDHSRTGVFGNRDLTTPGYDNAFVSSETSFTIFFVPGVGSDPYSSAQIKLEFPFYSDPNTRPSVVGSLTTSAGDMDSSAGVDYYQYITREELYGYYSALINVTQLNVLSGTGFAEGSNFQIFGVNRK